MVSFSPVNLNSVALVSGKPLTEVRVVTYSITIEVITLAMRCFSEIAFGQVEIISG